MTQADNYFANNSRYQQRIDAFIKEMRSTSNQDEASKLIIKFTNNTKLHLTSMKLEPSDDQYVPLLTPEGIIELVTQRVNK